MYSVLQKVMREGVKMKKLNKVLAFALTAVLAASAFFVGCANPASGDGSGNGAGGSGDWTKITELDDEEFLNFLTTPSVWESDWITAPPTMGVSSTKIKVGFSWDETKNESLMYYKFDYSEYNFTEGEKTALATQLADAMKAGTGRVDFNIDWEGDILRLSTDEGFMDVTPEIKVSLAAIMLNAGEISSDRKTIRLSMESESEYVYLKKVK